jgi:signal transduction histidine kinase
LEAPTLEPALVLVVDDEPMVRDVLRDTLERASYRVLTARDGVEALAHLAETRVDLLLSDVSMPTMDGYALYDRVRSRPDWATLPFVFLTALGEPVRIRHAKELGVDDYLVKPVTTDDLLFTVRTLLRRRAQLEAARSKQIGELKETILTAIAHELRTPLTAVMGYAELLREAKLPAEAEGLQSLVDGLLKGAERLKRLADDLVAMVDLRSGDAYRSYVSRRAPLLDLAALLQYAVQARHVEAEARHVTVATEVSADAPRVEADATMVSGALVRLVDNAIKFSKPKEGHVTLRARLSKGHLILEVTDDGVGIPQAELDHLWELFYQVDRKANEQQGTGCGLAIVHSVALMHGGRLEVTSEPGVGSTFALHLPALTSEAS